MVPAVVIDVMPADAPPEHARLMIDACTQAVQRGACVLASAAPENARPESVALVVWQPELLRVSVRVSRGDAEWVSRQIEFGAADAVGDRWTAVGLTVATLLDETQPASPPKPPEQDAAAAPPPLVAAPPEAPARTRLALDLGALTGTAWQAGDWQRGLWATLSATLPRTPLFALAGFSYAWSDGPDLAGAGALSSEWLGVSLGAGVEGTIAPLRLRLFAAPEVALQLVSAKLSAIGATLHDREARLRLRGGAVWPASGHFGFVGGGALRLLPFEEGDSSADRARTPRVAAELFAGIELRP